ncbi:MAG: pilus assembly protein [Sphingomonadaceae bacterium]|nr:pilus assembly protein [Sphingomonadaceae bacterium]
MIRRFLDDRRGVVAVEFALASVMIMLATLNAADVGSYVYQTMQVENAAQMAVQTVLQTCPANQLPATTTCSGLSGRVGTAVGSTALGTAVTLDGGQVTESYLCADRTSKLVEVGTLGSKPATCAAAGNASVAPGDYVVAAVSFSFRPMMAGASVAALLTTPIRRSATMRVG